jgi:ribosomal protein S18 acetylase RimI-like enzyme
MLPTMSAELTSPEGAGSRIETVELRAGTVADAAAVEAVHFASREAVYRGRVADWPPAGPDREGRLALWRTWLSSPEIEAVVAVDAGTIVGFCTVRRSMDADAPESTAEMPTLYVHPHHWRRGIGQVLCAAGVDRAVAIGCDELTLWVLEMNEEARRFYAAFGFTEDSASKVDEGTRERLVARRYRIALPRVP